MLPREQLTAAALIAAERKGVALKRAPRFSVQFNINIVLTKTKRETGRGNRRNKGRLRTKLVPAKAAHENSCKKTHVHESHI